MTPLNQNDSKCFYREIQPISDCSRKLKAIAGLLMVLLVGQRTIKSYHKMQIDQKSVFLTVYDPLKLRVKKLGYAKYFPRQQFKVCYDHFNYPYMHSIYSVRVCIFLVTAVKVGPESQNESFMGINLFDVLTQLFIRFL